MNSKFAHIPQVRLARTKFDLGHTVKTSMSVGKLYPIEWQEVLPGDTFNTKLTNVSRISSSFIKPVMDNLKLEIAHFFVPYRLLYDNTEKVFGNPNPSAYTDNDLDEFPTMFIEEQEHCISGTVGDYLGLPIVTKNGDNEDVYPQQCCVSLLPFRAFALIYDKWYRNQNVVDEMYIYKGEQGSSEFLNTDEWSPSNYMGQLPYVRKKYDYFTSCLPSPQKGAPVSVPAVDGFLPLRAQSQPLGVLPSGSYGVLRKDDSTNNVYPQVITNPSDPQDPQVISTYGNNSRYFYGVDVQDLNFANVNDLRLAFQTQRMLEADARGGSRYNEFLLAHFSVYSPDSRLQLPEYLGGGIIPINVQQTVQTSQSTDNSPLGNVAGYSLTNGYSKYNKSFTEHGILMTCACIRQAQHTYQHGIAKKWTRKAREDFYDPIYAHLGEQPVYKYQLDAYAQGTEATENNVFGFNEAWAEYRYEPNVITGQMRSTSDKYLDVWHFGNDTFYTSGDNIVISKDFIEETPAYVDRTLSIPSTMMDQFICDFYFDTKAIRVMPMFSTPGLIDHTIT